MMSESKDSSISDSSENYQYLENQHITKPKIETVESSKDNASEYTSTKLHNVQSKISLCII